MSKGESTSRKKQEAQPDICLSFKQPWAWLVANGYKTADGRNWKSDIRGTVLIHASKKSSPAEYKQAQATLNVLCKNTLCEVPTLPPLKDLPKGGIVGQVDVVDCSATTRSIWSIGKKYHYKLRSAKPLPFEPCAGQVMLFSKSTGKPVKRVAVTDKEKQRQMKQLHQPELPVKATKEPTKRRRFEIAQFCAATIVTIALILLAGYCLSKGFFALSAISMILSSILVHRFHTLN